MVLLILAFLLAIADVSKTCTSEEITNFKDRNLSSKCSAALDDISLRRPLQSPGYTPSESSLAVVCQESCGGVYSSWLNNKCKDNSAARIVQAACLFTSSTSSNGDRCRYLFPDATNIRTNFMQFYEKCEPFSSPMSEICREGCTAVLTNIVSHLGCCYQSLYNDTNFVAGFRGSGFINNTIAMGILNIGQSTTWIECGVQASRRCEEIQATALSSGSINHYSLVLLTVLTFMCFSLLEFI